MFMLKSTCSVVFHVIYPFLLLNAVSVFQDENTSYIMFYASTYDRLLLPDNNREENKQQQITKKCLLQKLN